MGDLTTLLPTAGPSAVFIIVISVLLRLWIRAERYADRQRERAERIQALLDAERAKKVEQIDDERQRRWAAEDAAAKARRRKAGDVDAAD